MIALRLTVFTLLLALLSGCGPMMNHRQPDRAPHGHYAGIGIYAPGKLWAQIVPADGEAKQDPALAKRSDDEAVIVVVDSRTGEVRECGNLSGYCASIQPWNKAVRGAPISLTKHADEDGAGGVSNAADSATAAPDSNRAK